MTTGYGRRLAVDPLSVSIHVIMALICFLSLYPFLHILGLSFSGVSTIGMSIVPRQVTLLNYQKVVENPLIWIGYRNTLIRVVSGTTMTFIVTVLAAYALSKRWLPGRTLITVFIVFTMFMDGGIIPRYVLIRYLGLMNTMWSLLLPRLVDTFALIVMRNFFMTLPDSLEESARLDGAGDFRILFQIVLPVSAPVVATVILWAAVWHWNSWFDALLYISDYSKMVLQLVLRRIVIEGAADAMGAMMESTDTFISPEVLKAASIIFTTIPILCVYPFLQKHFVKGIMVGSLKG